TPDGIARDVFVPVGLPDLIPTRMTLELANRAFCTPDGIARDVFVPVASYSNHPYRESVNLVNIFNLSSEDCRKDLVSNKQSGNLTFSLHKEIASPKVIPEIHDSKRLPCQSFKVSVCSTLIQSIRIEK
nr:hypothetical protein [Tanacetum cinerariifolium]